MAKRNTELKSYSQELRKNMTKQERKLWYEFLKNLSVRFYRQRIIENYIVDFYCPKAKLVIEIDGSQHYEDNAVEADIKRDTKLSQLGYDVVRYTNRDIDERFKSVCEDIYNRVSAFLKE